MNIYTVWCTIGRYNVNALVKARTKQAARNKMKRSNPDYRARSVHVVTKKLIVDFELDRELRQLEKAKADKIIIYDAGT